MEKTILKYLDFLLPIHNCVIIPELGGFIVNIENAVSNIDGRLTPPVYNIVFNPELNHNDGILASYIIKDDNITYNAACNKIKDSVRIIKSEISTNKTVACGQIGLLSGDADGNIIFSPNRRNNHPALYGLYPTNIQRIEDISKAIVKEKRNLSLKYVAGGIAAAAVALLLLLTPATEIKDNNNTVAQEASFISAISTPLSSSKTEPDIIRLDEDYYLPHTESSKAVAPVRKYYIVVAGEETEQKANALLSKIKESGFSQAGLVYSPERIRVYIKDFDDKPEAEAFLIKFRTENPQYESAWLHSQRD